MTNTRVLVTAATGKIGGAVAAQLLEKGITTRALVHRDDGRAAHLRASRSCGETSTPHRPTQPTIGSAQSRSLRYRYRRIAHRANDCRPSRVCSDSSDTRRIPLPPFN